MPLVVEKPEGWSPVESIEALRARDPALATARLAYAGRLDPMASGVMVVLEGDEVHEATRYQSLDKTYRVGVLFGVATDTYDALGVVQSISPSSTDPRVDDLRTSLAARVGSFAQSIPPFASYRVGGKPSFYWARRGLSEENPRPSPVRTIYAIAMNGVRHVDSDTLERSILDRIARVRGDFRQREIVPRWREVFAAQRDRTWMIASMQVDCSSGTFMRGLADDLGKSLGSAAIALTIERLRVGQYHRADAIRLEARQ